MDRLCVVIALGTMAAFGCHSTIPGEPIDPTSADDEVDPVDGGPVGPDAAIPVEIDAPPPPPPCVEGDLRSDESGTCYWVTHSELLDRDAAKDACVAAGGDLVIITDAVENQIIVELTAAAFEASGSTVPDYFLGATDRDVEGSYAWDDGTPFEYSHWRDGEPNNGGTNGENCAIMEGDTLTGTWDDRDCLTLFGYVCER